MKRLNKNQRRYIRRYFRNSNDAAFAKKCILDAGEGKIPNFSFGVFGTSPAEDVSVRYDDDDENIQSIQFPYVGEEKSWNYGYPGHGGWAWHTI